MMLSARTAAWAKSGGVPTAKDYVHDGLIHLYDGIENAGYGLHISFGGQIADLVGQNPLNFSGKEFGDDFACIDRQKSWLARSSADLVFPEVCTLELCFTDLLLPEPYTGSGNSPLIGCGVGDTEEYHTKIGVYSRTSLNVCAYKSTNNPIIEMPLSGTVSITAESRTLKTFVNGGHIADKTCGAGVQFTGILQTCLPNWHNFSGTYKMHRIAVYSRALSADEIAANYAIDKARFGLT